ncbi:hypothetical protein V1525DRAFT_388009 [Lipomyces kononenkoae]|uniref:Uncharacterized protein n=1 Tax=Lipomyces kononenkoae TaxID=34357 RepID=A0ACC3T350_LIPKO
MDSKIEDSSFVVTTGPPEQDKRQRISQVRSHITRARLRQQTRHQQRLAQISSKPVFPARAALGSPEWQLTPTVDLSWLPVSEAVCDRLKACTVIKVFHQYIESSEYIHPFFRSMIPATVLHAPLMSTKLVNATAWDDLNGPDGEISDLTLFQRSIAERILSDSLADLEVARSDVNITAILTLLVFEIVNGDQLAYNRQKGRISTLVEMRGGLDKLGFDGNLKITLGILYQLERVIKDFTTLPSYLHTLNAREYGQYGLFLSHPTDFSIFTFKQDQMDWRKTNLSTIRLLSDFHQLVACSIRYHLLYHDPSRQQRTLIHWNFLRDSLVALKSMPFCEETGLDRILLNAIILFTSDELDVHSQGESVHELRNLLWNFKVDAYHGPLPGALIWCLAVGARKSCPGSVRKWFLMQLTRISCPSALDDPTGVSRNLDLILAGLDAVGDVKNWASI